MSDQFLRESYDHRECEPRWQRRWAEAGVSRWRRDSALPKYYVLEMFPYTSGRMHIGHARNYTMGDVLARMQRARGFDVLYPMGWDAFGLPADNAAVTRGIHPRQFTDEAMANMKQSMLRMGLSYDWTCELSTAEASYIHAQQNLFLQFYAHGLVYRDTSFVNWCERCYTVLAAEQAANGVCWRCGEPVIKRRVAQWFFDIRRYADELVDGLEHLPGWPDSVKNIQRAWIGRSFGTNLQFAIEGRDDLRLEVFTTRVDTLFGCTYVALAPEHPMLDVIVTAERQEEVERFRKAALMQSSEDRAKADQEKSGTFTGCHAINPINGERVPIWTANYVLMDYGTGAVMAVPAHDQRDFEFATKYQLPIRQVIAAATGEVAEPLAQAYEDDGVLVNSGRFTGVRSEAARTEMAVALEEAGTGKRSKQFRLQNWSVSRQRYWGNPIPIIYCANCGEQPVPADQLPVLLPENIEFSRSGGSPLARSAAFQKTTCPKCQGPAERDTDTMDTFVDSSWYFLRFPDARLGGEPFERATVDRVLPVDVYIGGVEHATLHLMYSRFFVKVLRDLGRLSFHEPFVKLYNHGMVNDAQGRKQSKSLGNVVEPGDVIETYGADALRLYLMFVTAYNQPINWSDDGPKDAQAYLGRVWRLCHRFQDALARERATAIDASVCTQGAERELRTVVHETISKVTADIEGFRFNTAIASLMALTNHLFAYPAEAHPQPVAAAIRTLVRLLGVFTPHFAEEIWEVIGDGKLLVEQPWPAVEADALVRAVIEIAVQVNGKYVTAIQVPADATEAFIAEHAVADEKVSRRLADKTLRRTIHVPGRLVNLIAG